MLWLLFLLPAASCNVAPPTTEDGRHADEVTVATGPHIYFCRSPNMEDFSCWWQPLHNVTDGELVTYVLSYVVDKGPTQECPDYQTSGPNSCHFDSSHTSIWNIYCMNVTAVTARRNYTSPQHCLDVVEIVQTEAPVNLTFTLTDAGGDELGHNALLSWSYPVPAHLQYGWITLEYELQYRRISEPDNWKVKQLLREPHIELLGLPVSGYVIRVRCRSRNSGLWSEWSTPLVMSIPTRPPPGKLLLLLLLTVVGGVMLLLFVFVPRSRRIKDYFLPTVPKPKILGIDPLLLKKGHFDEISHHFSSFHGYRPPSVLDDMWDHVTADVLLTTPPEAAAPLQALPPGEPHPLPLYCALPLQGAPLPWLQPGRDYSVTERPTSVPAVPPSPSDFYTCVQLLNEHGEVHLVPCAPPTYCMFAPPLHRVGGAKEEDERKARKRVMDDDGDSTVPLLPVAIDDRG